MCGQEAALKAAVYSLNSMYNDENNDAVLLIDVNLVNRDVFLHNISYICPYSISFLSVWHQNKALIIERNIGLEYTLKVVSKKLLQFS